MLRPTPFCGRCAIGCRSLLDIILGMNTQPSTVRPASTGAAIAAVAAAAVLFGTSGVATRVLAPGLAATTTAGWRIVIGGGVLVVISAVLGRAPWSCPCPWRVIVPGALAFL